MAGIRLEWAQFGDFDNFDVLRSDSPMDINALPSPIITGLPTMFYVDPTVIEGATYYYRVVAWRDGVSKVSGEIWVKASAGDEHWNKVAALLHFDGSNNSTNFIEETGKSVNVGGSAKLSTATSVFGGASGYFDGAGYLSIPHSIDLNLSDSTAWTVEAFVYIESLSDNMRIVDKDGKTGASYPSYAVCITSTGKLAAFIGSGNGTSSIQQFTSVASVDLQSWKHIAIERLNNTLMIFINGNLDSTHTINITTVDGGKPLWVGGYDGAASVDYFRGYIDELRITKAVARYTANFTPPDAPFPGH